MVRNDIIDLKYHRLSTLEFGPEDGTINGYKIVFTKESKSEKEDNVFTSHDRIEIYKNDSLVTSFRVHLDGAVTINEGLAVITSDGSIYFFNMNNDYHGTGHEEKMPIVAYSRLTTIHKKDNQFIVEGHGCYWGCEGQDIYFRYILDKDLNVLDSLYEDHGDIDDFYGDDEDDDEEDEYTTDDLDFNSFGGFSEEPFVPPFED